MVRILCDGKLCRHELACQRLKRKDADPVIVKRIAVVFIAQNLLGVFRLSWGFGSRVGDEDTGKRI